MFLALVALKLGLRFGLRRVRRRCISDAALITDMFISSSPSVGRSRWSGNVSGPPVHGRPAGTAGAAPRFLTYLMSFVTLGIFWLGQQAQLNLLERSNRDVVWLHIGFPRHVCLIPFSTALLAEFMVYRVALIAYWANIFLLGALLLAAWRVSRHFALAKPDLPARHRRRHLSSDHRRAGALRPGAALCVFSTYWSIGFIVFLQLNYALAPRIGRFGLP